MLQRGNTRANVPYNRRKKLATGFIARHYTCRSLRLSESGGIQGGYSRNCANNRWLPKRPPISFPFLAINHSTSLDAFHSLSHSDAAILFIDRVIAFLLRRNMATGPVVLLLFFDVLLFLAAAFYFDRSEQKWENLLLSALFLCSGMPALIYQVVWQRALFSIYGVNAESVAVVVSAFMLGLGLGSLAGGWLSARFPRHGILIFGLAELGIAVFGLSSLHIFRWAAAYTAGANLLSVIIFSFALLLIPTILMGATLPILVEHLVRRSGRVGASVSRLYFVNTLGSAIACYLCALYLLRLFGQAGSVSIAVCLNTLVGAVAYLYGRRPATASSSASAAPQQALQGDSPIKLPMAMLLAGLSGFIALGFEIAWFRVFAMASADRAPAFALLLSTFLAGVAAGSFVSEKLTQKATPETVVRVIGVLLLLAGGISAYLPPLVAAARLHGLSFLTVAPVFFLTAAMLGSVLPLLCQVSVSADEKAGSGVSLVYVSNIIGSVLGSLGIGFVLMQHFGLRQISLQLGLLTVLTGGIVLFLARRESRFPPVWTTLLFVAALVAVPLASPGFDALYEKLTFGNRVEGRTAFARVVENRNGVISVTKEDAVFGGGVYDGYFRIDPSHDANLIVRALILSAIHPAPKRILMIGLSSGSWGQVFANHPQVESLDVVEINPGYLQLIPQYPVVRSLLQNPKVHIYVDDGRRWLIAHPEAHYDAIICNSTYFWRDHSTGLLSVEFFKMARTHLNPGGIYYFNTTESAEAISTALHVFPYGLRVVNFLVVSDSPLQIATSRWIDTLRQYKIDNRHLFDPADPVAQHTLAEYFQFANSINLPPVQFGLESTDSLRAHYSRERLITDNNMGREWELEVPIPWH
jgi:spermidine synthase